MRESKASLRFCYLSNLKGVTMSAMSELHAQIVECYSKGDTPREIASALNLTEQEVLQVINDLN